MIYFTHIIISILLSHYYHFILKLVGWLDGFTTYKPFSAHLAPN